MRTCPTAIGILVSTLISTASASAQAPFDAPTRLDNNVGLVDFRPTPLGAAVSGAWSANFFLGLPTGLRIQRALCEDGTWQAEGFLGLELIFPASGLGVRRRFGPFAGNTDAFFISPGFDVYLLYNVLRNGGPSLGGGSEYYGLFAADVEWTWQHTWSERRQGEVGLKLGAGVLSGERVIAVPVIGIFAGWRF